MCGDVHESFGACPGGKDFGFVMMRMFGRWLETGSLTGHPFEVRPGGLGAVEGILKDLKARKQSAVKWVFRVPETEGL